HPDGPAVLAHDLARKTQPDARPVLPGRKEGYEYLVYRFFDDPASVVGYLDDGAAARVDPRTHLYPPLVDSVQRLAGVLDEVDQHLLDQLGIGGEFKACGRNRFLKRDPARAEFGLHQFRDRCEEFVHREDPEIRSWDPGEPAIGLDEVEQSATPSLDGTHGIPHIAHYSRSPGLNPGNGNLCVTGRFGPFVVAHGVLGFARFGGFGFSGF